MATTGTPAGAGARSPGRGWIAPNRARHVWHYTRHRGATVCGNHSVKDEERRHEQLDLEDPAGIVGVCRKCRTRLAGSTARYFFTDWRG